MEYRSSALFETSILGSFDGLLGDAKGLTCGRRKKVPRTAPASSGFVRWCENLAVYRRSAAATGVFTRERHKHQKEEPSRVPGIRLRHEQSST